MNEAKAYNRSIIFLIDQNLASTLFIVQNRLHIRGYQIFPTHIYRSFYSYLLNDEFPFTERLNEILHWIQSAGLYEKWRRKEYSEIIKHLLKTNLERLNLEKETDIEMFPLPTFIMYGWIASVFVLIVEIIWKKFTFLRIKLFGY